MDKNFPSDYIPLFELGIINDNPAVKVFIQDTLCPVTLAALVTTLFETAMRTVEESKQINFEKQFNKSLKILMKERHNYEATYTYFTPDDDDE